MRRVRIRRWLVCLSLHLLHLLQVGACIRRILKIWWRILCIFTKLRRELCVKLDVIRVVVHKVLDSVQLEMLLALSQHSFLLRCSCFYHSLLLHQKLLTVLMVHVVRGFLLPLALNLGKFGHHSDNLLISDDCGRSWNHRLSLAHSWI